MSRHPTKSKVADAADQIDSALKAAASGAQEKAERVAEGTAALAERTSRALRDAAETLREGSFQDRTFGQIAAGLADASDAIRDKDLQEIGRDVMRFARRNPVLFVGGAALLGFAVARMMSRSEDTE